jgi:N-acetylneuraminic acid mutarotase
LPSGKIFVTGGYRNNISTNSSQASFDSELYDPATGLWSTTAALTFARFDHTATLLPNGKVLIAGGAYVSNPNPALATNLTELYDSATGQMSTISSSGLARYWQTSSLLPSGKVLMAGGTGGVLVYDISELFDPTTSSWNTATPLLNARYSHTSTTLQSGAILVVGGVFSNTYPGVILNTSELFY